MSPMGKLPVLKTPNGALFESNAIARYIARLRPDNNLYGRSFFESGQVDSWVDFCALEVEIPATMWTYPILGWTKTTAEAVKRAQGDLRKALNTLNQHLATRTFVVGEGLTLADICLACALYYPFKLVLDNGFQKPFGNVVRWFKTCVNQPQFIEVIGEFELCKKALPVPNLAPAKGAAKAGGNKKKKKEKKKQEPKKPAAPKKPKKFDDVVKKMKKSSFVGDDWKRHYSNDEYADSMAWFWENFDKEGWSLWTCKYKFSKELEVGWKVSNFVGGFFNRCDAIRKYAFGTMTWSGEDTLGNILLEGCWILRGQDIEHITNQDKWDWANPEGSYFEWTQVKEFDENAKKTVTQFWCGEEGENTAAGRPIIGGKVFK